MHSPSMVLSRRLVLRSMAGVAMAATAPALLHAEETADAILLTISDLHAPYARMPALLETVRTLRATGVPTATLINGDIFERGNVVCLRSAGAADWAFLAMLAEEMPVIVNLGNHETALLDDFASFVAKANQIGVRVISNLIDRRTGRFFAPFSARIGLGGIDIALLGLATTTPFVYRAPVRETVTFLDVAQFVSDALPDSRGNADIALIMSHAGVSEDKGFINDLPAGTLVQGAHDHLMFDLNHDGVPYFHGGSWGTHIGVLSLKKRSGAVEASYRTQTVLPEGGDAALAAIIEERKNAHLTADDRAIIAELPSSLDLHRSILLATDALRLAVDADVAMLSHTTFGSPLAAGPLSRYDFDAFMRFGGGVRVVEISGVQLAEIAGRANQFTATDLSGRTGDYVHVAALDIDAGARYRLAVNDWTAKNQERFLGTKDLPFEEFEGIELKALVAAHLATLY